MSASLDIAIQEAKRLGAEDVEVSQASTTTEFVRFAHSRFTQVGESRQDLVRVRALSRGRLGVAMCASLAPEELRGAASQAMAIAERVPPLEVAVHFHGAGGGEAAGGEPWTPPEEPFEAPGELRRAFDRAAGVAFFGAHKRKRRQLAVVTAGGRSCAHSDQVLQVDLIAQIADGSGWAGWYGARPAIHSTSPRWPPAPPTPRAARASRSRSSRARRTWCSPRPRPPSSSSGCPSPASGPRACSTAPASWPDAKVSRWSRRASR
jgi:predicted Zn-dependent protease